MRRFRVILLFISMVFLIASCGSSTNTTAAVTGEGLANNVPVL